MVKCEIGSRIWFTGERMPYTVQAISASGRFMACTRPFAPRQTVLYSMLDLEKGLRGVDDSIGNSLGYETREDCQRAVNLFEIGDFGFSSRTRPIALVIRHLECEKPHADQASSVNQES